MNQIVIGFGEIGKAVAAVIGETHIEDEKIKFDNKLAVRSGVDIMHVCFPYDENFSEEVHRYAVHFQAKHIIIYSTVPIGTTQRIMKAVHSPIEGKHPDLEMSIRQMERWIGYNDKEEGFFFSNYFTDLGLRTKLVENTDFTEALKLLSTTEYGINIEFARYKKHVADSIAMDYELMKQWNTEYNKLYRNLGLDKKYQKFVLDAPDGPKGGHCVTPNAVLLDEQYPSQLTKIVGEIE